MTARTRGRSLHTVERADLKIAEAVALDGRTVAGKRVGRFAELGDQPPMQLLSGAVIVAGAMRRDHQLFRAGLRMIAAHGLATLAKSFVKDGVDRTRPGEAMSGGSYRLHPGKSHAHDLQSMPSGHSAGVVAVAASIIADYPVAAIPVAAGSTAILSAQLPSRNHFLTDVVAGGAIGLAAFGLMYWLLPPISD